MAVYHPHFSRTPEPDFSDLNPDARMMLEAIGHFFADLGLDFEAFVESRQRWEPKSGWAENTFPYPLINVDQVPADPSELMLQAARKRPHVDPRSRPDYRRNLRKRFAQS